ncbi:hypothetical protein HOY80DRAFT_1002314 [Tuber brumale]|nr:hypothetical protein HOY80DRAFT_1002314 [Tuber brumale]
MKDICPLGHSEAREQQQLQTRMVLMSQVFVLAQLGSPPGLHAGLGDLPLHPDKGGWYSVLGPWDGAADTPGTDELSEENLENNLDGTTALTGEDRLPFGGSFRVRQIAPSGRVSATN